MYSTLKSKWMFKSVFFFYTKYVKLLLFITIPFLDRGPCQYTLLCSFYNPYSGVSPWHVTNIITPLLKKRSILNLPICSLYSKIHLDKQPWFLQYLRPTYCHFILLIGWALITFVIWRIISYWIQSLRETHGTARSPIDKFHCE